MVVRHFLDWFDIAPARERAEAARMMAQCCLSGELGEDIPGDAEAALMLVLDDPAISVRAALAWELAQDARAPRQLVIGLAHDVAEVASPVLARSPLLGEADLVDCVGHGDPLTHLAIAMRQSVSERVALALAERADARALCGLLDNGGASIPEAAFRLMLARHGGDGALREALNRRDDLPADVRQSLVSAVSDDLLALVSRRGWIAGHRAERAIVDAREAATIALARDAADLGRFVAHLAETDQLTPALLLRSLLCGDTTLFGAALVTLSGVSGGRVAGMLGARTGAALAAACVKAGLPRTMVPAFTAALAAIRQIKDAPAADGVDLQRPIIAHVLAACLHEDVDALRPVIAMLRRFDAEAARAQARADIGRFRTTPLDHAGAAAIPALPDPPAACLETACLEALRAELETPGAALPADIAAGAAAPPAADPPRAPAGRRLRDSLGARLLDQLIRRRQSPAPKPLPDDLAAIYDDIVREDTVIQPPLAVVGEVGEALDGRYFGATEDPPAQAAA